MDGEFLFDAYEDVRQQWRVFASDESSNEGRYGLAHALRTLWLEANNSAHDSLTWFNIPDFHVMEHRNLLIMAQDISKLDSFGDLYTNIIQFVESHSA